MYRRMITISLTCCIFVALAACGEDPESDNDSEQRPEQSQTFISDAQLEKMQDMGLNVHFGTAPPDISGIYETDSLVIENHDNEERIGDTICDYRWNFETTDDDGEYDMTRELIVCDGEDQGSASYLSGTDNCFTLYNESEGTFEGCETATSRVISGCLGDDGIEGFHYASMKTENEGDECEGLLDDNRISAEGETGILVEQDELAERVGD